MPNLKGLLAVCGFTIFRRINKTKKALFFKGKIFKLCLLQKQHNIAFIHL